MSKSTQYVASGPEYVVKGLGHKTVIVTVPRVLVWRVRLGVQLMRFGAWVATLGFREETDDRT